MLLLWSMVNRSLNILKIFNNCSSTFIFGPRGAGKSYLAKNILREHKNNRTIDLLLSEQYSRYLSNPALLRIELEKAIAETVQSTPLLVLIDEIQRVPEILNSVHWLLENKKGLVHFILTGSSARKIKRNDRDTNLLAGRAWVMKLHPLTPFEVDLDLERALQYGTLPGIYFLKGAPVNELKSYIYTYLNEEIKQEALVRKYESFHRFLEVAGQMNGEPINFTKIAKLSLCSVKTAQGYFSILEDTFIVHKLEAWSRSVKKQLTESPKYYFFDCGVLNGIRGELGSELKESSYRAGKLFESFIIQNILRLNDYLEKDFRAYHWRTKEGKEVDLVLSRNPLTPTIAIEIKSSVAPAIEDLKGLVSFKSEFPNCRLVCLCKTPEAYDLDNSIEVLPWKAGILAVLK